MFLSPGSRMLGKKGRRVLAGTPISSQWITSTTTLAIPQNARGARVIMIGSTGGGGGGNNNGGCPPTGFIGGQGGPSQIGFKALSGLIPGATLVFTVGLGGNAGARTGNGTTGGTTSISSGTMAISTVSIAGGTFGGAASPSAGGAAGSAGTATGLDAVITSGTVWTPYLINTGGPGGNDAAGTAGKQGAIYVEWLF